MYVLPIFDDTLGEHRPHRDLMTLISLLRSIKLWYFMPALLLSLDGCIKRRHRPTLIESGRITFMLL